MERDLVSVDGMVVAITGGCGGIGMATARSFALRGAKVALGDLDPWTIYLGNPAAKVRAREFEGR